MTRKSIADADRDVGIRVDGPAAFRRDHVLQGDGFALRRHRADGPIAVKRTVALIAWPFAVSDCGVIFGLGDDGVILEAEAGRHNVGDGDMVRDGAGRAARHIAEIPDDLVAQRLAAARRVNKTHRVRQRVDDLHAGHRRAIQFAAANFLLCSPGGFRYDAGAWVSFGQPVGTSCVVSAPRSNRFIRPRANCAT